MNPVSLNEISIVELLTTQKTISVCTSRNVRITKIIFHPQKPIMYIQANGTWKKLSFLEVK